MRCDAWEGALSWWSCQSPVAHSCSLLNHLNRFHRGMFKFNTKFDADSLLYSLGHFECDSHTVYMLGQWHLPPPLTSTMTLLFTHARSSPLSLAAWLHWCANCSCYINDGWTFSGQTSYTHTLFWGEDSCFHQHLKRIITFCIWKLCELGQVTLPFCASFTFTCKTMELFCHP